MSDVVLDMSFHHAASLTTDRSNRPRTVHVLCSEYNHCRDSTALPGWSSLSNWLHWPIPCSWTRGVAALPRQLFSGGLELESLPWIADPLFAQRHGRVHLCPDCTPCHRPPHNDADHHRDDKTYTQPLDPTNCSTDER
jgi:hypothetical protein